MSAVLLAGTGEVGIRTARQLVDTPAVERLWITSRDPARARDLATAMGARARVLERDPHAPIRIPEDVRAVAVAGADAHRWVRAAHDAGVAAAVVADAMTDPVTPAPTAGPPVVNGCGLMPGVTDVLVRHAASVFDTVDEVHVARVGAAGRACVEEVRAARRAAQGEWRDGTWRADRGYGPELLWFPEPIGARECQLVRTGLAEAVATVPTARHATARLGPPPTVGRLRRGMGRDPVDQGWGAARIEVTGWRQGTTDSVVYGVVDRTAIVTGVVLAVTAAALGGFVDAGVTAPTGTATLGEVVEPVPFLTELDRRGVKAAAFEGVVPH